MKKISEKILRLVAENDNVDPEDMGVYEYTLQSIWILGLNVVISLVIGFALKVPVYCFLFLGAVIFLRSYAGGYHASKAWQCYIMSCLSLLIALIWIKVEVMNKGMITAILAVVSCLLILRYAPLEAENKPLNEKEKYVIGRRAKITALVELACGFVCMYFDKKAACAFFCALIFCALTFGGWFLEKGLIKKAFR